MEELAELNSRFEGLKAIFTTHDSCEEVNVDTFEEIEANFKK